MSKPIINVDLDGVVYPFIDVFRRYLYETGYVKEVPMVPSRWEVWEDWKMTQEEWITQFRKAVNDQVVWTKGDPIPGAREALWTLDELGFHIRIATNRLVLKGGHRTTGFATLQWLDRHSIPYHSLAMLGGESKASLTGAALVDDKPGNIAEWQWTSQRLLFAQPWNKYSGLPRYKGWTEVVKELTR